ncbi:sugar ABC transporter ATP-binding protein [Arthrobacter bambusae]
MTMTPTPSSGPPVILTVDRISKSFPGVRALDEVSLQVRCGEIVALLGQNGSGKSTLVKILAGVYMAESGSVVVTGADGVRREPYDSLHFIHQDLGLIDTLSAVENLALGRHLGSRGLAPLGRRSERHTAEELISRFGSHLDVRRPVAELSPAQRTLVAIARAMSGWTGSNNVLVLDEPTASLNGEEVGILFAAIRQVADAGAGVVFISHRLEEVTELADRVVVLRDGKLVADQSAVGLDADSLAVLITGREATAGAVTAAASASSGPPILTVRGLAGVRVEGFDLDLAPGEIVGVAGSIGSGREQLAALIYGAHRRQAGDVAVNGRNVRPGPRASRRAGLALVPADRRAHGGVMTLSAIENLVLPDLWAFAHCFQLSRRRQEAEFRTWAKRVGLQPPDPERALGLFSGGNQQKVVIARWLRIEPSVLLVEEPTQGVDVGASEAIRQLVIDAAAQGVAVLVTSSDNADLIRMCDRVLVLRDGVAAAELHGSDINEHRLTRECLGTSDADLLQAMQDSTTTWEETHA